MLVSFTEDAAGEVTTSIDGVRWIYPEVDEADKTASKATDPVLTMTGEGASSLTIDFICDYYSYGGDYLDTYALGEPIKLKGTPADGELAAVDGESQNSETYVYDLNASLTLADAYFNADDMSATYRFTDIYGQEYWTPVIP